MDNRKALMAGVGLVAAVCIGAAAFSTVQTISGPKAPPIVEPSHEFLCQKCQALFSLRQGEIPPATSEAMTSGKPAAVDCPKCQARESAYSPTRCPSCGKHYISDFSKGIFPPPGSQTRQVCPHCGTDPYIWHRQHVKPKV